MKHVNLITRQLCSQFHVKVSYNIKLRLVKNYKTSKQILMKLKFINHKSKIFTCKTTFMENIILLIK